MRKQSILLVKDIPLFVRLCLEIIPRASASRLSSIHVETHAASDLVLHCLPMSHKRTLGLYVYGLIGERFENPVNSSVTRLCCHDIDLARMEADNVWKPIQEHMADCTQ